MFNPLDDIWDSQTFLSHILLHPEKNDQILSLFNDFYPWLIHSYSDEKQECLKEADSKMLTDFFEYFSCNYMDDIIKYPERISYQLCGAFGCWNAKWQMSSTYFNNEELYKYMIDFWNVWYKVMRYEPFYSDEMNGYHYFRNWNQRYSTNTNFDKTKFDQLKKLIKEFGKKYHTLLQYIKTNYHLDLQTLSETFEKQFG